jgi:hypothetical protein
MIHLSFVVDNDPPCRCGASNKTFVGSASFVNALPNTMATMARLVVEYPVAQYFMLLLTMDAFVVVV